MLPYTPTLLKYRNKTIASLFLIALSQSDTDHTALMCALKRLNNGCLKERIIRKCCIFTVL